MAFHGFKVGLKPIFVKIRFYKNRRVVQKPFRVPYKPIRTEPNRTEPNRSIHVPGAWPGTCRPVLVRGGVRGNAAVVAAEAVAAPGEDPEQATRQAYALKPEPISQLLSA